MSEMGKESLTVPDERTTRRAARGDSDVNPVPIFSMTRSE